jgi:iron only hydrogenase large subunit-like protein
MRVCPTEAIRIKNGKATIFENKCIDCGECYRVCPSSAIYIEQDDFNSIFNYKYRVALLPVVLSGQFHELETIDKVFSTLKEIGFTHIYEVENSTELLSAFTREYINEHQSLKPLISCFCPAIVRFIQVKFPSLTPNLIPLKQPLDYSALYYKKSLIDQGIPEEEIGVFYITPCAAQIAAVKSPVGEKVSAVTGVINMDLIYNRIRKQLNTVKKDNINLPKDCISTTETGILWPLTWGEVKNQDGRGVAIDGLKNVTDFLEKLENEEISGFDFLELRACDESCAGGILASGNRFLTVEHMKKRAQTVKKENNNSVEKDVDRYKSYLYENKDIDPVQPRCISKLDENTEKAIEKMQKVRKLMCFLPGFDCGVCGAPSCQALAEDIAQGESHVSNCLFLQRVMERNKKLSPEHAFKIIEDIWGTKRLDKNCNKKGANYDGF